MPDYAAVRVFSPISHRWELMSDGGRVIVFDTAEVAWNWLPLLGGGRSYRADVRRLCLWFHEISTVHPNRAAVVTPYVPGEAQPWRRHRLWSDWWRAETTQERRDA